MRILHTSDWHIGKNIHNRILDEDFLYFIDWLINVIKNQKIDILLIAGDIFDVAYPSSTAQKLYYLAIAKLIKTDLQKIIVISGNHDSVAHLKAPSHILKNLNVEIFAGLDNLDSLIYPYPEDNPQVVFVAVPFVREIDILKLRHILTNDEDYDASIAEIYKILYDKTEPYRQQGIPIIATGHLFVTDGWYTSEEKLNYPMGMLVDIPSKAFPPFDYIALGHVHKPLEFPDKNIYYSSNPFLMSFHDILHTTRRRILIYDTDSRQVEEIQVPLIREFVKFEGELDKILEQVKNFRTKGKLKPAYGQVTVTKYEDTFAQAVAEKIRAIENSDLEILDLRILPKYNQSEIFSGQQRSLKEMSEIEIFEQILEEQNDLNKQDKAELKQLFRLLLDDFKQNHA